MLREGIGNHQQELEELRAENARLQRELAQSRASEAALQVRTESGRRFSDQLRILHELSLRLEHADSLDALCRLAVEEGCRRFGFDRLSLWLIETDLDVLRGTYGIDEQGRLRSESDRSHRSTAISRRRLFADFPVSINADWPLLNERGEIVGRGWHMMASLRDGDTVIGVMNADNFIRRRPLQVHEPELLGLYGAAVGHLYARARAEAAMRASEQRFRSTFEQAAVGIAHTGLDGRWLRMNQRLCEMLGYTHEELLQRTFQEITFPGDLEDNLSNQQRLLAGEIAVYAIEKRYIRKGGSLLWVNATVSVARDPFGEPTYSIVVVEDIEERVRAGLELQRSYDTTIEGWSKALDLRDKETEGHSRRVTEMTLRLARALKVPADQWVHVRRGALLHDIGKMGVPDSILLKPGPLSDQEWEVMRRHPEIAYELLGPIEFLRPALAIPYCHHEKWDGTGYPNGLKGLEIPLAARIFTVADVCDALLSDRPYRPAWSMQRVREYICDHAGFDFDPHVVDIFLATEGTDPA